MRLPVDSIVSARSEWDKKEVGTQGTTKYSNIKKYDYIACIYKNYAVNSLVSYKKYYFPKQLFGYPLHPVELLCPASRYQTCVRAGTVLL